MNWADRLRKLIPKKWQMSRAKISDEESIVAERAYHMAMVVASKKKLGNLSDDELVAWFRNAMFCQGRLIMLTVLCDMIQVGLTDEQIIELWKMPELASYRAKYAKTLAEPIPSHL